MGWPLSAVPGAGVCVQTFQFDSTRTMRPSGSASSTVRLVAASKAWRATFTDLPAKFGILSPAAGVLSLVSVAGQDSSSLTVPKSIFVSVECMPGAGVCEQTFQFRSAIWLRPRPRASWEVRV